MWCFVVPDFLKSKQDFWESQERRFQTGDFSCDCVSVEKWRQAAKRGRSVSWHMRIGGVMWTWSSGVS